MVATPPLRLITVPTRAQRANIDAIGEDDDTLSDALSGPPNRETLAWHINLFATTRDQALASTPLGTIPLNAASATYLSSNTEGPLSADPPVR
jgi:hypothetical protein